MNPQIMVAGATGLLGTEIVRTLSSIDQSVTATSRNLEKLPGGVRTLQLNFDEAYLLQQGFRNVDVLVLCQPLVEEMTSHAENIIKAAKADGVQFVLRVSQLGADPRSEYLFQRIHGETDQMLRESGLKYCILRPNVFMQEFFRFYADGIEKGVLYLPQGEGRTSYVDARDIALFVSEIVKRPFDFHKETFDLTGERALSMAEAVSILSLHFERRLAYVPVTEHHYQQQLEKYQNNHWLSEALLSQSRAIRDDQLSTVTEDFYRLMGRSPLDFESFCRETDSSRENGEFRGLEL